jgi:hypothetical protein
VQFTVVFSEAVTGVAAGGFELFGPATAGSTITSVSGSGISYTVTVSTGSADGLLGLRLVPLSGVIDNAGNVAPTAESAVGFAIDKTAPDTAITSGPARRSGGTAAFAFAGTDPSGSGVASFEYSLDGGAWTPSAGTLTLVALANGDHTLSVRAIDLAGNRDATPATYAWVVDTLPPAAPSIDGISPDTGASATDRVTNTGDLTVWGTAEPGVTLSLFDGARLLGTVTADSAGGAGRSRSCCPRAPATSARSRPTRPATPRGRRSLLPSPSI